MDNKIRLIDLGNLLEEYSYEGYIKNVKHCFRMLRYPFLKRSEFRLFFVLSHLNKSNEIDSGYETFLSMCEKRNKEDLYDNIII